MTDRVYPSAKPTPPPGAPPPLPTKTTNLYNPNHRPRPLYNPTHTRRSCTPRRCCCLTFIYMLITILTLLLISAIVVGVFYFIYHPKHPEFTITSVTIPKFNLTATDSSGDFSRLVSTIKITISARNTNKKHIVFMYDPFSIYLTADGVNAGNSSLPGFTHLQQNTTILRGAVVSDPTKNFDTETVSGLKSDLSKKTGFPISVMVETKVKVKMGKFVTKRVGIRVDCDGVHGFQPKNTKAKTPTLGSTTGAKCKVDLRFKIWKFTF